MNKNFKIDEQQELKRWSATFLTSYKHLGNLCRVFDDKIRNAPMRIASMQSDALACCEYILGLNNSKRAIINVKVIVESCLNKLPKEYRDYLVGRYIHKKTRDELVAHFGYAPATATNRQKNGLAAFAKEMVSMGYDLKRIKEDYANLAIISDLYSLMEKDLSPVGC